MVDDLYICELCDKSFYGVDDYGHCGSCEATLCLDCRDEMFKVYGGLDESHENYLSHGYSNPSQCSMCVKPTLNKNLVN